MCRLPEKPLAKQLNSTSCWISAAHFVLQYLGEIASIGELIARFQHIDQHSVSAMAGAGKPSTVLQFFGHRAVTQKNPKDGPPRDVTLRNLAGSINRGVPVICHLASQQVAGWGHAVLIVGVDPAATEWPWPDGG